LELWKHNSHHLLFYPSVEEAARWEFNGSRLNDWRMTDVKTGQPVFLPTYQAEEFCMNNPEFRAAYAKYLEKLKTDVPIDGLMSDDNIFYADWRACGCKYCRQRFQNEYGHDLPPTTDANFWGNSRSEAFKDWIAMRFRSSGDFLIGVKNVFPEGFPLLTCCSNSDRQTAPAFGMSYQDFIKNSNHIMLEMTGSTPSLEGTWDNRIPSQLLHLGIARDYKAPCFGLGYGFFPYIAFFIWALNKFLGSDCWFSTDAGRIAGVPQIADDPELVGEGFRWEKAHPQLFTGQPDTNVAVLFSRATRDYFAQVAADYCDDYSTSCLGLTRAGVTFEVVTDIPDFDRTHCLVLSSVVCLSAVEKAALKIFLNDGGTVIATGPNGFYDQRANPIAETWLDTFGVAAELNAPVRPGGFPPYANFKLPVKIAQCRAADSVRQKTQDGWLKVSVGRGELLWHSERISKKGIADRVIEQLHIRHQVATRIEGLPSPWRLRQYRDGDRRLIHALPGHVKIVPHPTFKWVYGGQPILEKLQFTPLAEEITLGGSPKWKSVVVHSPDLPEPRAGRSNRSGGWSIDLSGIARYFVLELKT
jgi:hypothetical protein